MSAQLTKTLLQLNVKSRCSALFPVSQVRSYSDAKDSKSLELVKELKDENQLPELIPVEGPSNVSCISGVPEEHIKGRLVRIYQTPKNAMQSGTDNVNHWEMEFETRQRWENPLMGWSSTGDPVSNIKLQFENKEAAIRFVERNGYEYFIEPEKKGKPKVKSYGFNFSWNKRSRVSTK